MGSLPIERVHLLSDEDTGADILRHHLALSSTQARTPPFQGGKPGSTPGRVTIAQCASKAPLHNSDGKPLEGIGLRKKSHPAVE